MKYSDAILKEIENFKKDLPVIKELNFTDAEIHKWLFDLRQYDLSLQQHKESDNNMCYADHFDFIRDEYGNISTVHYYCDKQRKVNSLNDNIVLSDYRHHDDYQLILKNTDNVVFHRSEKRQKFTKYVKSDFCNQDKQARNCYLFGETLSGKSFAGFYLLKCCIHFKKDKKAAYINIKNFCSNVAESYNNNYYLNQFNLNKYLETLQNVDYLFIDEIGTEKQSPSSFSRFNSLLKERSKSKSKTTILISSKPIAKLRKYYSETTINCSDAISELITRIKEIAKENEIEIDKVV